MIEERKIYLKCFPLDIRSIRDRVVGPEGKCNCSDVSLSELRRFDGFPSYFSFKYELVSDGCSLK